MSRPRLCLITPCRDEAPYARRTLDSVLGQTRPPDRWVIVDDGSTDETPEILDAYAREHPSIRVIRRADRGVRKVGPGVIDAFYAGYEAIDPSEFDYVCKLDLDLDLPPRYFEILIARMEADPRIGTASGKPYFRQGDALVSEKCGDENSVGMTKLYRRSCFEQIGGFVREVMWDGIDGHRCRMLGWVAVSWDDPELRFEHLRPMGTSHKGWWTGRARHGFGQYFMGTAPSYMIASALFRMSRPPLVVGGLAMLSGYFGAMLRGLPRYDDPDFRRFLRSYQRRCLLQGKARTTADCDRESASRWSPDAPASGPIPERSRS
jgi:glycosyltransferase involved in cell wall biosynthesis